MKIRTIVLVCGLFVDASHMVFGQPVITAQPQNQAVSLGGNAMFSVRVERGALPFSYQWRFNQTNLPAETNFTLLITNVQRTHAGQYTVIVTDNFEDIVTSDAAVLSIVPSFTRITKGSVVTDAEYSFGCAWGDYDNDGYLDLIVGNGLGDANALYHNNGDGTFTRVTTGAVPTTIGDASGCSWGDYDNDGDLDLFIANWKLPSFLFRNEGNGEFTRIIEGAIGRNVADSLGCAWGDYNNDGFLDLVVANTSNRDEFLYRNNGDGTFIQDFTGAWANNGGHSGNPSWGDYDNDGRLDLFISSGIFSDRGGRQALFHNDGGGKASLVSTAPTGPSDAGAGDWGDYDNDGDLDLFVAQYFSVGGVDDLLYRNDGDMFTRITTGSVVTSGGRSLQGTWGDFDNDGWLDLFVNNDFGEASFLFHNNRDGTFTRMTEGDIVSTGGSLGSCTWVDYDNDGFLDMFVFRGGDREREPNQLFHNNGNSNGWLTVKCVGTASNRSGIGAKVRVKAVIDATPRWQLREIGTGNGYSSSRPRAHFGLGGATNAEVVRVEWPSGIVQELRDVAANQFLSVREPPLLTTRGMDPFGEVFRLMVTAHPGLSCAVEYSTNLVSWNRLTNFTATTRVTEVDDPGVANGPTRFYRALLP